MFTTPKRNPVPLRTHPKPPSSQLLPTTNLLSLSLDLPTLDASCEWNHTIYGPLWLASFGMMFSNFAHVAAGACTPFLLIAEHYPIMWRRVYHILLIRSSADRHVGCSHFGAMMNNTAINISFLLGVYVEGELLDHTAALCLTLWGTARLFSTAAAPFCIPTSSARGFRLLHVLTDTCYRLSECSLLVV